MNVIYFSKTEMYMFILDIKMKLWHLSQEIAISVVKGIRPQGTSLHNPLQGKTSSKHDSRCILGHLG